MALYPIEQAVLDRYDAGQGIDQIARATGFLRKTVQETIWRFDVNLEQDAARERKVRSQTARLGELVRQAGGHR